MVFTTPLIAGPYMSLSHSIALYLELLLRSLNLQRHMVLVTHHKLLQKALACLLLWPLALAIVSLLLPTTKTAPFCYQPWSHAYWYIIMAVMASLTLLLAMSILFQWIRKRYDFFSHH